MDHFVKNFSNRFPLYKLCADFLLSISITFFVYAFSIQKKIFINEQTIRLGDLGQNLRNRDLIFCPKNSNHFDDIDYSNLFFITKF